MLPRIPNQVNPKNDGQQNQFTRNVSTAIDRVRHWVADSVAVAGGTAPDTRASSVFVYTASGATLTIPAPEWPERGRRISIEVRNDSGGALTVTWNAKYVFVTAYAAPEDGFHNTVQFHYDETADEWREELRLQDVSTSFVIENRTSDPPSPETGQVWLRTDL